MKRFICSEESETNRKEVKEYIHEKLPLHNTLSMHPLEINDLLHWLLQVEVQIRLVQHVLRIVHIIKSEITLLVNWANLLNFVPNDKLREIYVLVFSLIFFINTLIFLLIIINNFLFDFFFYVVEVLKVIDSDILKLLIWEHR